MSCLLRLSTPLESNFKALFSSTNRLCALSDTILLLAGRRHVGHKNAYRLNAHGSACQRPACTRVPPPTPWSGQTHVCKWGCAAFKRVASERVKRTLWLVAATKLVCPLLPGRSCGEAAIRSHAEIIGKKECYNRHFASGGLAFYEQ